MDWVAVCPDFSPAAAPRLHATKATWRAIHSNKEGGQHGQPTSAAHTLVSGILEGELVLSQLSGPRPGDVWRGKLASGGLIWQQQACSKVSGEIGPTQRSRHSAATWLSSPWLLSGTCFGLL